MSYCINSLCQHCHHPDEAQVVCQSCGTPLIIQGTEGRYRLLSAMPRLSNRFVEAFEAIHQESGNPSILKTLVNTQDFELVTAFEQERNLWLTLDWPGLPKFQDYFSLILGAEQRREIRCLVIEKAVGTNLEDWLTQNQKICSAAEALDWFRQLAQTLDYIHQHQYFRPNLRPNNIILQPDGKLVLIDFSDIKNYGAVSRLNDGDDDISKDYVRSDLQALGQTFLHLLIGESADALDLKNWQAKTNLASSNLLGLVNALVQPDGDFPSSASQLVQELEEIDQENVEDREEQQINLQAEPILRSGMDWQPGDRLQGGDYVIVKRLGIGGFSTVYLATDRSGQQVVIKTLHITLLQGANGEKFRNKFINEAVKIAGCKNRHIVKVDSTFLERVMLGQSELLLPCVVLEYIEGQTLQQYLNDRGTLPEAEAVEYIRQIGEALTVVHREHLLHRDVKPDNIMIRANPREAVLIDFGIARQFVQGQDQTHTKIVTEGYAPTEQYITLEKRGAFTDVYALAATLYTLLTGERPPNSLDRRAAIEYGGRDRLIAPKTRNTQISDWVNRAILKGMEIQSRDRPQTVQDWLNLLVPTSTELFKRALEWQNQGDYTSAIRDYTDAINTNQDWDNGYKQASALYNRGLCYSRQQDYQSAIENYNQAIGIDPESADAYYNRGLAKQELGAQKAEALADFQEADRLYQNLGNLEGHQNAQQKIRELSHNSADLYQQALNAQHSCGYHDAISYYTKAIKRNEGWDNSSDGCNLAKAYYNRGVCHREVSQRWRALYNFWRAASLYQPRSNERQNAWQAIRKLILPPRFRWRWNRRSLVVIAFLVFVLVIVSPSALRELPRIRDSEIPITSAPTQAESISFIKYQWDNEERNNPKKLIDLLNAIALRRQQQGDSVYTIGVAVESYKGGKVNEENKIPNAAGEDDQLLRGVAQAQLEQNCGFSIEDLATREEISSSINENSCTGNKGISFYAAVEEEGKTPGEEINVAKKLRDAGVAGVIGHSNSSTTFNAFDQVYRRENIILVSPTSTAMRNRVKELSESFWYKRDYLFRTATNDKTAVENLIKYLEKLWQNDMVGRTVGAVYQSTDSYSQAYIDLMNDELREKGVTLVSPKECDVINSQGNWAFTCLEAMHNSNVEVVLLATGSAFIDNVKEIIDANYKSTKDRFSHFLGSDTVYKDVYESLNAALSNRNFILAVPWARNSQNPSEFERSALAIWGTSNIDWRTITGYDATKLLAEAVIEAKQNNSNKLRRWGMHKVIKAKNVTGALLRPIEFDKENDRQSDALGVLAKYNPDPKPGENALQLYKN